MSKTEVKIQPHQKEAWALMLSHSYTLLYGGARCLHPDTEILSNDGYKKIKDIIVGTKVPSLCTDGKIRARRVKDKFEFHVTDIDLIVFNLKSGEQVKCKSDHRFMFNGDYLNASVIASRINNDGEGVKHTIYGGERCVATELAANVESVHFEKYTGLLYDIEVYETQNFFIARENIISHNSGKTFIILLLNLLMANTFDPERAKEDKDYEIRKPSRHLIVRFHFSDVKKSIIRETLPEVAALLGIEYKLNQQDWYIILPNGSEIWFGGIDEGRGLDRVLGKEYSTIWFNEASQIKYNTFWFLMSRLAQDTGFKNKHMYYDGMPPELSEAIGWKGKDEDGNDIFDGVKSELSTRVFFDENPPSKAHWTYKVFIEGINPDKRTRIKNTEDYVSLRMNPDQNKENIDKGFLSRLEDAPDEIRTRMLEGNFADEIKGSLFNEANIANNRIDPKDLPRLRKVVIAIDPATTSNENSDETGIIASGLYDGRGYVLEDASGIYSPKEWADKTKELYIKWGAECVVAESNQGGEMVQHTIETADKNIPVELVTAGDGKYVRAQPVSVLYNNNKVSHVGHFGLLEEEQTTYTGDGKSPNRLDALVYSIIYLFPVGLSKEGEPFNEKNIVYFEDNEDFKDCRTIAFLKIGDAKCYNFSMIIVKIKQGHFYITEALFNVDYPNTNLLRVLSMIGDNDVSKLFIECDLSYGIFAQTLIDQSGIDVIGSLLPSDAMNRILLETKFIKTNFTFRDNILDGQYTQFMKQMNYFTNLAALHERFAADLCAFASFMIHINMEEFKK